MAKKQAKQILLEQDATSDVDGAHREFVSTQMARLEQASREGGQVHVAFRDGSKDRYYVGTLLVGSVPRTRTALSQLFKRNGVEVKPHSTGTASVRGFGVHWCHASRSGAEPAKRPPRPSSRAPENARKGRNS